MIKKILFTLALVGFLAAQAHAQVTISYGQSYNSIDAATTGTGVFTGTVVAVPTTASFASSKICMTVTLAGGPSAVQIDLQAAYNNVDSEFQTLVSSTTTTSGEVVCALLENSRLFRAKQFLKTGGTTVTAALTVYQLFERSTSVIASAATIAPTGLIHHISGTAAIGTITVPTTLCVPTCTLYLIPDAAFTTTAAVNISLASTAVINKTLIMTWDGTKWNPSY